MNKLQNETSYFWFNFIECDYPGHLTLDALPRKYKKIVLKDINELLNQKDSKGYLYKGQVRLLLMRAKKNLQKVLFKKDNIPLLESFFIMNMKQDKLRKQSIFDINHTKQMYDEYMVDLLGKR